MQSLPTPETSDIEETPLTLHQSSRLPQIYRTFIIGGATIYDQALDSLPEVNRILLTRVVEPSFDECDVFLPEFRPRPAQDSVDADRSAQGKNTNPDRKTQADTQVGENVPGKWQQADHEELVQWVGFEVPRGLNEEKEVKYEYQMWVRRGGSYPTVQ